MCCDFLATDARVSNLYQEIGKTIPLIVYDVRPRFIRLADAIACGINGAWLDDVDNRSKALICLPSQPLEFSIASSSIISLLLKRFAVASITSQLRACLMLTPSAATMFFSDGRGSTR